MASGNAFAPALGANQPHYKRPFRPLLFIVDISKHILLFYICYRQVSRSSLGRSIAPLANQGSAFYNNLLAVNCCRLRSLMREAVVDQSLSGRHRQGLACRVGSLLDTSHGQWRLRNGVVLHGHSASTDQYTPINRRINTSILRLEVNIYCVEQPVAAATRKRHTGTTPFLRDGEKGTCFFDCCATLKCHNFGN